MILGMNFFFSDALRSFSGHVANESADVIGTITSMIVRLKSICGSLGDVTEVDLLNAQMLWYLNIC